MLYYQPTSLNYLLEELVVPLASGQRTWLVYGDSPAVKRRRGQQWIQREDQIPTWLIGCKPMIHLAFQARRNRKRKERVIHSKKVFVCNIRYSLIACRKVSRFGVVVAWLPWAVSREPRGCACACGRTGLACAARGFALRVALT